MSNIIWGIILILIITVSCETVSLEERSIMCKPVDSDECIKLRKRADRLIHIREGRCPSDYVIYRDHKGSRCVSEREINRMLGGDW